MTSSEHILDSFVHLYGSAASLYALDGNPDNDEILSVTVWFPDQPDRRFVCEPSSDDDGSWHFAMDDSNLTVVIPYSE